MKMLLGGAWVDRPNRVEVLNPFDDSLVDTVPRSTLADVEQALVSAERGARAMRGLTGYHRYEVLHKVADLLFDRMDDLARTITLEEGKILAESRMEAMRAREIIALSAEEAKRLSGDLVPLDGAPSVRDRLGFTVRVPCGIVLGITPFNFPLHLVCHKLGPAFAAGNACIIKPATDTPLSALKLVELFLEAGAPPEAVQCLTGPGRTIGRALCRGSGVRRITFTGSRTVGTHVCKMAGLKRVTMELGSNAPLIVMPDADLERVADAVVTSGYFNAGQACISTQRVIAHADIYGDLLDAMGLRIAAISAGDPMHRTTGVGPMIRKEESARVSRVDR